jgi:hypothetical protein
MNRLNDKSKLTDQQREYVVARLAAFDSPAAIAQSLRQEFGISITRQAIDRYDPTRCKKCPERWKQLFFATRQATLEGKAAHGAADNIRRARVRDRLLRRAVDAITERVLNNVTAQFEAIEAEQPRRRSPAELQRDIEAFINRMQAIRAAGQTPNYDDLHRARTVLPVLRRIGLTAYADALARTLEPAGANQTPSGNEQPIPGQSGLADSESA